MHEKKKKTSKHGRRALPLVEFAVVVGFVVVVLVALLVLLPEGTLGREAGPAAATALKNFFVALCGPGGEKRGAKSKRGPPRRVEGRSAAAESVAGLEPRSKAERHQWGKHLFILARKCAKGDGVKKSDEQAARYCRMAAESGLAEAQFQLGNLLRAGRGVPQDSAEAARWFRLASNQGLIRAHYNLALLYLHGNGVAQDSGEAVRLFRLTADASGYADAQCALGRHYRDGDGVKQDYAEAARWFQLAATQEHPFAQCDLGICYRLGEGVPQDFDEARHLFELAAAQGNAPALLGLGGMYEEGLGVEKNVALAKQYYRRAGKEDTELVGGENAEELRTQLLDAIKHTCASCKKVGDDFKVCIRCKGPRYCSVACQREDWREHKRVCQRLAKDEYSQRMARDANDS